MLLVQALTDVHRPAHEAFQAAGRIRSHHDDHEMSSPLPGLTHYPQQANTYNYSSKTNCKARTSAHVFPKQCLPVRGLQTHSRNQNLLSASRIAQQEFLALAAGVFSRVPPYILYCTLHPLLGRRHKQAGACSKTCKTYEPRHCCAHMVRRLTH